MPGYLVVAEGVVQGPEGRLLFPEMNVMENLEMGAFLVRDKSTNNANLQMVFEMFPRLKEREK
jgi:branched-chain amino acid transport system ATP-binding protein